MSSKRPSKTAIVGLASIAAAVFAIVGAASPASAHHCGTYGTHTRDGWCLKKIKSKWSAPRSSSGQATGKRQHMPLRLRMYYDQ